MAKITSKLQVTLPKRIAEQHGLQPGDEIEFHSAGESIRIVPAGARAQQGLSEAERLRMFDEATRRQEERSVRPATSARDDGRRDWTREELYERGSDD